MAITYHDLYLKTRMALSSAGIEAAQLEAREILCAAAEKTAEELYRDISLYTTDAIAEKTEALQARRLAGEPIAYLLGEWSFCGLPFFVSPAALIPRVDTEMLAQLAMNRLKEHPGHTRILDLCAGTGCVGLTAAALLKNTRAVLVDLSDGALDLCKRNIRRHKLTGRAVSLKGDALQAPSHALGQFDVLVCNPPYIPTGDLAVKLDIIQKSGSWFSMGEERIGQGKDAAKQYLRDNPEICERVEAEIRQNSFKLLSNQAQAAARAAGRAPQEAVVHSAQPAAAPAAPKGIDVSADDFDDDED